MNAASRAGLSVAIESLRARGAPGHDPVRFRMLEALAQRMALQPGMAPQRLHALIARLLADCSRAVDRTATRPAHGQRQGRGQSQGPLAALLAQLAAASTGDSETPAGAAPSATPSPGAPAELRAVRDHRQAWAQLGAERRLLQALAQVPGQAGPLNTQRLLHQALRAMHDASPGYLQHFVLQVEALLWLDRAGLPPPATPPATPRPSAAPQARRRRHARPGGQQ